MTEINKRLKVVSSEEADFCSLRNNIKEFLYIHILLFKVIVMASLLNVYLKNAQCLTKHYGNQRLIRIKHVKSEQNLADLFTKGWTVSCFSVLCPMIL